MTDITFVFNADTRSMKGVQRRYAGNAFDSESTTLHFEYEPIEFPSDYTAYIQFAVYDDDGNPLIYSLNSTPVFDGFTFDIPWDVTRRVNNADKVTSFQLYFVKNTVTIDDIRDVAKLDSTEYLIGPVTKLAFRPTITCKPRPKCGCPPLSAPTTEPNVMGYINIFRDYGIVVPVQSRIDEKNGKLILTFQTYNGTNDQEMTLDVAITVDGKVPASQLPLITEWGSESDDSIATSKLVKDSLDAKTDVIQAIPIWDESMAYPIMSAVMHDGRIWISLIDANVGNVPGYGSDWVGVPDDGIVINEWNADPSRTKVPSEALVKSELDAKTDKTMAIPQWNAETEYSTDSSVIYGGELYISLSDANIGNVPTTDGGWWTRVEGKGGSSGTASYDAFTKVIGDDSETYWIVEHTFKTEDVFVQLREASGDMMLIDARTSVIDSDHIAIQFENPPARASVAVTISPMVTPDVGYIGVIGNGKDTEFDVKHRCNTLNFFCQLKTNDESKRLVKARVRAVSKSTAHISFTSPPKADGIIVMIAPAIGSEDAKKGGFVFEQTEPATVWHIDHGLGKWASVYLTDENHEIVIAEVKQIDIDTTEVYFDEPAIGYAILN